MCNTLRFSSISYFKLHVYWVGIFYWRGLSRCIFFKPNGAKIVVTGTSPTQFRNWNDIDIKDINIFLTFVNYVYL